MDNKTSSPIDWVEDVCTLILFMTSLYDNKIYSVGGALHNTMDTSISDSYLRIVDFSKPVDSSKNIIDISTDRITTAIRIPGNIPLMTEATSFISDGVMHILPGRHSDYRMADADANILEIGVYLNSTGYQTNLTSKVLNFNIESREWDLQPSGMVDKIQSAAVAFDDKNQVGWYYSGMTALDPYLNGMWRYSTSSLQTSQALYRLDRGKGAPTKVETDSSATGDVVKGELVYIEGVGEAGILVLVGGMADVAGIQVWPMKDVHVYDIATNAWFAQTTTTQGGMYPSGRIEFCSVVASAEDNSSHNIYIYGGLTRPNDPIEYDVWILTLPAFQWVQVYPNTVPDANSNTRRISGHQCHKVHEKHMVAYRGGNFNNTCDGDKEVGKFQGMAIYDMSALEWTTKVELDNAKYLVPQVLYEIIGGDATGNANRTKPELGFEDAGLGRVFANITKIQANTTTPVNITTPVNTTTLVSTLPKGDHLQRKLPTGAIAGAIVGGIFGCLVLLTAVFFIMRRRRRMDSPPQFFPELACSDPHELQECGLYELHDPRNISELPTLPGELAGTVPIELYGSVPKEKFGRRGSIDKEKIEFGSSVSEDS